MDKSNYSKFLKLVDEYYSNRVKSKLKLDEKDYHDFIKEKSSTLDINNYKIVKDHTLEEFFTKYSKYLGRNIIALDKDELWLMNPKKEYWEIKNDSKSLYFEVPTKTLMFMYPYGCIATAALLVAGLVTGILCGTLLNNGSTSGGGGGDDPEPDPYDFVPTPEDSIAITAVNEEGAQIVLNTSSSVFNGANALSKSIDGTNFEKITDTSDVTINIPYKETLYLNRSSTSAAGSSSGSDQLIDISNGSGEVVLSGNIKSLIGNASTIPQNGFAYMFAGPSNADEDWYPSLKILSAKKLILLFTTLSSGCYQNMFTFNRYLKDAPELPATEISEGCYFNMFYNCSSLISTPELPATTLKQYCYNGMFQNCDALVLAHDFPASCTLGEYCCDSMFQHCISLKKPPKLPNVLKLEVNCYESMFYECTALESVPLLTCAQLANSCYQSMFLGCSNLTVTPYDLLPATTLAEGCYYNMFNKCTSLVACPALQDNAVLANHCYQSMFDNCTSLNISDTNGAHKIVTVPNSYSEANAFAYMFSSCGGTFSATLDGTPFDGYSYYYN